MCGIFGIAVFGTWTDSPKFLNTGQLRILVKKLLELNTMRGSDAAGLAVVDASWENINIIKRPVPGKYLITSSLFEEFAETHIVPSNIQVILGHTRSKTLGSQYNNKNNHPVVYENMVSVHNGYVNSHEKIFHNISSERKAEVDSEAVSALLNQATKNDLSLDTVPNENIYDTNLRLQRNNKKFASILEEFTGSVTALAISADIKNKLMLMRKGNEVAIGWLPDHNIAIFSSVAAHIREACKVINVPVYELKVQEIENNTFSIFSLEVPNKITKTLPPKPIVKFELKDSRNRD